MKKPIGIILIVVTVILVQLIIIRSKPKVVVPTDYFSRIAQDGQQDAPAREEETPPVPAEFTRKQADTTPVDLPFELLGTLIAGGQDSIAYIRDTRNGIKKTCKIGSSLREYEVIKIALREVTLSTGRESFVLKMTHTAGGALQGDAPVKAITEISSGTMIVNKRAILPQIAAIIKQAASVKLSAQYADKELTGMQIDGIADQSVLAQAGLRNNDVIQTVNNQKVTSYQKALQLAHRARTQKEIQVTLLRNGESQQISYRIE